MESGHLDNPRRNAAIGVIYGGVAYLWWGFVPVYFKAVTSVAPLEVLAHRVLWSVVLLGVWMLAVGRGAKVRAALADRRTLLTLMLTTLLVASNWFVFIWSVGHDEVVQASLGYYINPLVNVLLGYVLLGERLRRAQWLSVGLAAAAVLYLTLSFGHVPFISLWLAGSFGTYGLLRKVARVDGMVGLTVETALLAPVALGYLVYLEATGGLAFLHRSVGIDVLLVLAGVVTALPLVWFANAVRRLPLSSIGFLQYIAPTLQLLLAVVVYGEPFGHDTMIAFLVIWSAILLFSADALRSARRVPQTLQRP